MGGGRRWPLKLVVKGASSPVRLAVGIAVAGLAWNASHRPAVAADSSFSSSREKISSAVDGVIRSSRAIYTIAFVVVDYKFLAFDEQPIAAASIAQVHHGLLKNNQEVAVKIFPDYRFDRIIEEFERAMALELGE
ncbi:ABC1 family [Musa troglodytarum]|uniref:ABC1 family n=1 Tax=Musa troglodytarum TaxID=320322 RepID=A0A9E7EBL8_9LILI|nr:ABC1 family [Musa troglodytarum]